MSSRLAIFSAVVICVSATGAIFGAGCGRSTGGSESTDSGAPAKVGNGGSVEPIEPRPEQPVGGGSTAADSGTSSVASDAGAQSPPPEGKLCGTGTDPFSREALAADIEFLASDERAGRAPGTPGDQVSAAYIQERFRCLGLTPANPGGSYLQPFVTSNGKATTNVVAYLPGRDSTLGSEIVLMGAHYDHLGVAGGQVFNGANDNASGVAAMLAVARALRQSGTTPRRTIAFVAFGFEEHNGVCEGSEFFVRQPPATLPLDRIVYIVNTDMVGTYFSEGVLTTYGSFPGTPARTVLDGHVAAYPSLKLLLNQAADQDSSDFQAFCNRGIPYLYFETWDLTCYHKPCDDAARIDYPNMGSIAKLSRDVVVGLGDTDVNLKAARSTAVTRCPGP
jgi:hypothetical protein